MAPSAAAAGCTAGVLAAACGAAVSVGAEASGRLAGCWPLASELMLGAFCAVSAVGWATKVFASSEQCWTICSLRTNGNTSFVAHPIAEDLTLASAMTEI